MVSLPLWSKALVVDDARRSVGGPRGHERPRRPSVWSTRAAKDSPGTRSKGIGYLALRGRPRGDVVNETVLLLAEVVKAVEDEGRRCTGILVPEGFRSPSLTTSEPRPRSGPVHLKRFVSRDGHSVRAGAGSSEDPQVKLEDREARDVHLRPLRKRPRAVWEVPC